MKLITQPAIQFETIPAGSGNKILGKHTIQKIIIQDDTGRLELDKKIDLVLDGFILDGVTPIQNIGNNKFECTLEAFRLVEQE